MKTTVNKKHMAVWCVVTVVLMCVTYYAGTVQGGNSVKNTMAAARSGMGGGAGGRNRFGTGGGNVSGQVLSMDAASLTVQSRDGSSKIILYTPSTQVLKTDSGAMTDIATGVNVMIQGTQNADGSVTASSIQIRPAMPSTPKTSTQ